MSSTFLDLPAIWLYILYFHFMNFYFFQYSKTIFKFCCARLIFFVFQKNIYIKTYTNMLISRCRQDKVLVSNNFKWKKLIMLNVFTLKWKKIKSSFFCKRHGHFKLFVPNAPFLYTLKTKNLTVFWCFQGVENSCIENKWVNMLIWKWLRNLAPLAY